MTFKKRRWPPEYGRRLNRRLGMGNLWVSILVRPFVCKSLKKVEVEDNFLRFQDTANVFLINDLRRHQMRHLRMCRCPCLPVNYTGWTVELNRWLCERLILLTIERTNPRRSRHWLARCPARVEGVFLSVREPPLHHAVAWRRKSNRRCAMSPQVRRCSLA